MSGYENSYRFYADTGRLVAGGASLRELYDAMMTVQDEDMAAVDGSPARLAELTRIWVQRPVFVQLRLNELFGGLTVEHTDDYVLALVGTLAGRYEQEVRLHLLRNDHDLRETVFWRIFEVEGGGEVSLANIDKFSPPELNWHNSVVLLVEEGTLDRVRTLRSCLEALNRDFSAYRAGWFSRVYAALAPTPSEAAADQALLTRCLGSTVTATVSFAVKHLVPVQKAGLLDADSFVDACAPALTGPKSAAMPVVKILEELASSNVVGGDRVAEVLTVGLGHPHADVQRAVGGALRSLGRIDLVEEQRDVLAPAVAAALLPVATVAQAAAPDVAAVAAEAAPAVSVTAWTADDAVERYAALLEDPADALEFELALSWLVDDARAAELLAPLGKRARTLAERDEQHYPAVLLVAALDSDTEFLPQRYWQEVSTHWADGVETTVRGERRALPTAEQLTVLPSYVTRLREVAAMLQGRAPRGPLLATPTDSHGRVDAVALRDRFRRDAPPADLAQALLRVSPDERARLAAELGVVPPAATESIEIEWRSRGSETRKADGTPQWVWWDPVVVAERAEQPSMVNPAFIGTGTRGWYEHYHGVTELTAAQLALVEPSSTLPLTAAGLRLMNSAAQDTVEHRAVSILASLSGHPGIWTAETVQLVALGMAGAVAELRAQAAELLVAAVPVRLAAAEAARGFAACAPGIVLTRWAASFADAAMLAPETVVEVLSALMPAIDRKARGLGALLTVLLDESVRRGGRVADPALREWLSGFSGSSAAAKTAKALLTL
ncbi:DUF6493 family protein [Microbacterium sp.]|uniref:DUF6493 family protein n=1 Tax=Microbacterium sp. TaxID=51671 RepID=UPI00333EE234